MAGMFTVEPAPASRTSPRKVNSISPSRIVNISSKSWRCGGGPPPHRHDFEEMFTILDGEIELTFRGETHRANAGSTVNIPANAPHSFKNKSDKPARLLCMCTPAGQEEFFMAVGDPVDSRTAPPPKLSDAERAERIQRAKALSAKYRTELLV